MRPRGDRRGLELHQSVERAFHGEFLPPDDLMQGGPDLGP